VRLVAAAPELASASVALNTSVLYIGQALGSAIGGILYARDWLYGFGYVSMVFVALALIAVIATGRLSTSLPHPRCASTPP
jgi:DHA1 family inner membrane transport protein